MTFRSFRWYGPDLDANPLVDSLDHAASVAYGIATVLELVEQNNFDIDNDGDPLLTASQAGSLLRLAIASAHLLADDALRTLDHQRK